MSLAIKDKESWSRIRDALASKGFILPFFYRDLISALSGVPARELDEHWAESAVRYAAFIDHDELIPVETPIKDKLEAFDRARYRSPEMGLRITRIMKERKKEEIGIRCFPEKINKETPSAKRALLRKLASQYNAQSSREEIRFLSPAGFSMVIPIDSCDSRTLGSWQFGIELKWGDDGSKYILLGKILPGIEYYNLYNDFNEATWGLMANYELVSTICGK